MNIFVVHPDSQVCARALDDKRVGKMLMESNQLLSTAVREWLPDIEDERLCRPTHASHPCSVWARRSYLNFDWLLCHARELNLEWHWRFATWHGSGRRTEFLLTLRDRMYCAMPKDQSLDVVQFVNCAGNFKHLSNVHEAYRQCMRDKWHNDVRPPRWSQRGEPEWR